MSTQLTNFVGEKLSDRPTDPAFDETRLGISIDPGNGTIYKTTIQQWVTLLTGLNVSYAGAADTTTDPGTPTDPVYYTATTAGTYTNFEDSGGSALVVADGEVFSILSFDGSAWSKQVINFPAPENKINDWVAQAYSEGDQVNNNGQLWAANTTTASTDIPGISDKWTPVIDALMATDYLKYSVNLIDNSKVLSGLYLSADGTVSVSNDSIRTPLIPIDATQEKISIAGAGSTINSYAARFAFFDAGKAFISYSNTLTGVDIPATAAYVGITLAYNAGIGNDPTNSMYKDTMIVNYGSTAEAYVPYAFGIDAEKIYPDTLNTVIENNKTFSDVKAFTDGIAYQSNNLFDKTKAEAGSVATNGSNAASDNWIRSGYISITPSTLISVQKVSTSATNSLSMAFYDSDKTFISGIVMSGQTQYQSTSPDNAAFLRCTIANVVNIGLTPTDNSYVNSFMVNYGDYMDWEPGPQDTYVDGSKIFGLDIPVISDNAEVYVSLDPTGYSSKELFVVYVKRQGEGNHYVGFQVGHAYDMSDLVYMDEWRIIHANEYTFDGTTMTATGDYAIINGESECVYMPINRTYTKADFAGGFHGNEIYSKFKFLIDGLPVTDLTAGFTMKACKQASYIQYSQIHEPPDVIDGVDTPVDGHPVECDHVKHTVFEDGGYTTYNTLIWAGDKPNFWYHGICCMGKIQAANGFDEDFSELAFTGSLDETNLKLGNREFNYYNSTNKLSSHITSTLYAENSDDTACQMFIWDRASDSKYYRQTPQNLSTAEGEVYKSVMQVTFRQEK